MRQRVSLTSGAAEDMRFNWLAISLFIWRRHTSYHIARLKLITTQRRFSYDDLVSQLKKRKDQKQSSAVAQSQKRQSPARSSSCHHSCGRLSRTFSLQPPSLIPLPQIRVYSAKMSEQGLSLKNTHHFLDGSPLQSLAGDGGVLRRKRGFCALHSSAFISPIVVLGIGWLMRASWG